MSARDEINSMAAAKAVQVAYFTATQLQDFRTSEQLAGIALFLNEACQQLGIDPRQLFNQAERMAKDADTFHQREVKALRDYIKGEL